MRRENRSKKMFLTLSGFLLFFFNSFFYIIFHPLKGDITLSSLFYNLGKFAGLTAFVMLSFLIISGDTARFFDRFFGMDKIIKFQRKFALLTSLFVILHPIFFILSSKSFSYLIPSFILTPLTFGIFSFYLFIIIMTSSFLYKRISYNMWQYIHILIYILFFSSIYHAFNLGSDSNNLFIRGVYLLLMIGVILTAIYRVHYKLKQKRNKFTVEKIIWETKDAFTIILKPNKRVDFKSGQFCFLRLKKDKLYARHPFSISSSPENENLHFTVKIKGRFTKALSELKKGDELIVEGPFGVFNLEDKKKDLVFIAGGVGITPFMSMIRNQLKNREKQNILLISCTKIKEDIIFKDELDKIKEEWFKKVYILSQENSEISERGHINKEIIKKYIKDINNSVFYICGPERMKDCAIKELKELGVKKESVIVEDFFW